jgi:predicted RNA-binding protein with RPS1 domain
MAFKPKQELEFRVVGYGQTPAADARRSFLELSLKPSEMTNPKWDEVRKGISDCTTPDAHVTDARLAPQSVEVFEVGKEVVGYVEEIGAHSAGLGVSTQVRGRLHVVESASDPSDMRKFKQRFKLGDAVKCRVVAVEAKTHSLELSCKALGSGVNGRLEVGDVMTGRVSKVLPGIKGLLVQVGIHNVGHVAITELGDRWRERPLEGFATGQFVKCAVLDVTENVTENVSGNGSGNGNGYELSLREKLGGCGGEEARMARGEKAGQGLEVPRVATVEDLSPGQEVWVSMWFFEHPVLSSDLIRSGSEDCIRSL